MHVAQRTVVGLEVAALLGRQAVDRPGRPTPLAELATIPGVEQTFVHYVLRHLRIAGLVTSKRGVDGGWALTRPPHTIAVSDIVVALDGPLLAVDGDAPETSYTGGADQLLAILRHAVREVLEAVTVADLANGNVPIAVGELVGAGAQTTPT
jgi:Rrf2 family protein